MNKTLKISLVTAVIFFSLGSLSAECFNSIHESDEAHLKLKAQVVCGNSDSLRTCQNIFLERKDPLSIKKSVEENNLRTCTEIAQESVLPLNSATVEGLINFASKYNGREYVNSATDFYYHTQLHKERVLTLALKAFREFPEEFAGLDEGIIRRILTEHDDAKVKAFYSENTPFFQKLYEHYGKRPPAEVIDKLNKVDATIIEHALEREGLAVKEIDPEAVKSEKIKVRENLKKLENLADFVDRAMNPVSSEEFGREMWKESTVAKTETAKIMALFLEKNYKKFTKNLNYNRLKINEYFKLTEKISVDGQFKKLISAGKTFKEMSIRSYAGFSNVLKSRSVVGAGKVLGRGLLVASTVLDGVLLATYSNSFGCDDIGSHDWVVKDGRCMPAIGLTENFIKYLNFPTRKREKALNQEGHMCHVVQENLKLNESNLFSKVSCSESGAKMEIEKDKSLDVKFDKEGNISEIKLQNVRSLIDGILLKVPERIHYGALGMPSEFCYNTPLDKSCASINEESVEMKHINNFISSMNYKIHQAMACCLGVKNKFNEKITCSI